MRHRKHRFQLGRKKEHREALMANLAVALLTHGRIQTTLAKAKALRPFIEKIVSLAKRAHGAAPERALYLRRLAIARVRDRVAIRKLFDERVEEFLQRSGGYTRIYKLQRRIGDAAEMALIEFVAAADEGYPKRRRKSQAGKSEAAAPAVAEEVAVEAAPEAAAAVATEEAVATETKAAPADATEEAAPEPKAAEDDGESSPKTSGS